jgi:transaldolase
VEELIGAETVNTLPPDTLEAFLDHGEARASLGEGMDAARAVMADLARVGIDMDAVTETLQEDGVRKFADAFDKLMGAIDAKREQLLQPAGR